MTVRGKPSKPPADKAPAPTPAPTDADADAAAASTAAAAAAASSNGDATATPAVPDASPAPTPAEKDAAKKALDDEDEEEVTAEELTDEKLKELIPELADNAEALASLGRMRDTQKAHDAVFEEYIKAKSELEERFEKRFAPLFAERRKEISAGKVPDFWVRCIENCEMLSSNITEKDTLAMHYLEDLWCDTVTSDTAVPDGLRPGSFVLHFRFRDNPFFTNQTLTKTYAMGKGAYDDFPVATGCDIFWKPGKNLTLRTFRKKTKNGRTVVKHEPTDSFFNFFSPPDGLSADDDIASDIENVVEADVELGEAIRNDLIPRALYYFLDLEDSGDEDDEDDSDDDEDDDDEEEDAGATGNKGKRKGKAQNGHPK